MTDDDLSTHLSEDDDLIAALRKAETVAWEGVIARYEGRLFAYAFHRLGDRGQAEDVVQETFLGFLNALPHYDSSTPLNQFLLGILRHKLVDQLRRRGTRPALVASLFQPDEASTPADRRQRAASSLARSAERKTAEERVLRDLLAEMVAQWTSRGEFERLRCCELLVVRGLTNQEAARHLGLSEQAVANHKSYFVQRLKKGVERSLLRAELDWREWGLA